jgi:hypothetical protein
MRQNESAITLAASLWHDAYPRSNFYASDSTNQRKWIAIAERVINSNVLRYAAGYRDGYDDCVIDDEEHIGRLGD